MKKQQTPNHNPDNTEVCPKGTLEALRDLFKVHGWLMKGIGAISVPDYGLVNMSAVNARAILAKADTKKDR